MSWASVLCCSRTPRHSGEFVAQFCVRLSLRYINLAWNGKVSGPGQTSEQTFLPALNTDCGLGMNLPIHSLLK